MPALVLDSVSVARGGRAVVSDVSLSAPAGEITTILGPNGAGKSSLLLGIAGLLRLTTGSVQLGDTKVSGLRPDRIRAAGVSVVPEGRKLLTDLSVADNLNVATYTLPRQAAKEGIDYAVGLFPELEKRWDNPASALSGGEQQMVVLAQALVSRPQALLVDELSLGLAPIVIQRLVPTLAQVAADGVAVLLIEQFAHVALALANNAYILEGGRIQYSGTSQELIDDPELLKKAYLLGA